MGDIALNLSEHSALPAISGAVQNYNQRQKLLGRFHISTIAYHIFWKQRVAAAPALCRASPPMSVRYVAGCHARVGLFSHSRRCSKDNS